MVFVNDTLYFFNRISFFIAVPIPTGYLLYFLKIAVGEIHLSDGQILKTKMNLYTIFIGNIDPVYHYLCKSVLFFHRKIVPSVQRFDQRLRVNFLHSAFYQKKLFFVFIFLGMKLAYLALNVPEKYIVRIN